MRKVVLRYALIIGLGGLGFSTTALAIVQLLQLLGMAAVAFTTDSAVINLSMGAGVAIGSILQGFAWYNCQAGFVASLTGCKTTAQTQAATATNSSTLPIKLVLRPQDKRQNPDPKRFDNPPSQTVPPTPDKSKRDVTPKASYSQSANATAAVTTNQAVVDEIGGAGFTQLHNDSTIGYFQQWQAVRATDLTAAQPNNACGTIANQTAQIASGFTRTACAPVLVAGIYENYIIAQKRGAWATAPSDPGYSCSGGNCTLTDATQVKKPDTTPCEPLYNYQTGSLEWDPANRNCDGLKAQVTDPGNTNRLRVISADAANNREAWDVTVNPDKGFTVCQDKGASSTKDCFTTAPYDDAKNGFPITGKSTGPGNDLSQQTPGTAGPANSNPGNGNPSTGQGASGGSCGGVGQPSCSIDDSSFNGKTVDTSGVGGTLDGKAAAYSSQVSSNATDHGVGWSQIFSDLRFGIPHTCEQLDLNFGSGLGGLDLSFNPCTSPLILLCRQVEAYLLYLFTLFYCWRRFLSSELNVGV